jgi:hypothetical protein
MPTSATPKRIGVSTLSFGNRPVMMSRESRLLQACEWISVCTSKWAAGRTLPIAL